MQVCATVVAVHPSAPGHTTKRHEHFCETGAAMSRHEMAVILAARPSFARVAQQALSHSSAEPWTSAVDADGHVDTHV